MVRIVFMITILFSLLFNSCGNDIPKCDNKNSIKILKQYMAENYFQPYEVVTWELHKVYPETVPMMYNSDSCDSSEWAKFSTFGPAKSIKEMEQECSTKNFKNVYEGCSRPKVIKWLCSTGIKLWKKFKKELPDKIKVSDIEILSQNPDTKTVECKARFSFYGYSFVEKYKLVRTVKGKINTYILY